YVRGWFPDESIRPVVELHAPFIVLRSFTESTVNATMMTRVYRLWKGNLYRTFELAERDLNDYSKLQQVPPEIRFSYFPSSVAIGVRSQEDNKNSCDGYEWTAATWTFERSNRASDTLCGEPIGIQNSEAPILEGEVKTRSEPEFRRKLPQSPE